MKILKTLLLCSILLSGSLAVEGKKSHLVVKEINPLSQSPKYNPPFSSAKKDPFWNRLSEISVEPIKIEDMFIDELKLVGIVKLNQEFQALLETKSGKLLHVKVGQKFSNGEIVNITINNVTFSKKF